MIRWFALGAVLALSAPAFAQDPGVSSELERTAVTSPDDKLAYDQDATAEMGDVVRSLTRMLEQVQRDNQPDNEQCVRNALTAAQSLMQVSEAAGSALQTALSEGRTERADHEFRKIAIALTKARQILSEGERCAYGDDIRSGQTTVKWEGGVTEGVDETLDSALEDVLAADAPPNVSPF